MPTNLIHLDLKGTMPSESRLCEWLTWLAAHGFDGVVFEFDDRLDWQTWPGAFRPGYDHDAWQRVLAHCASLELSVTPLIQTFGHLEWLLKHEAFAAYREAEFVNLLCPHADGVQDRLRAWIDEVIALHPGSEVIHIGGDEVHHIGSCPTCDAAAKASPHGVMGIFMDHMLPLVEHVQSRGRRAMVWPSMFALYDRHDLIANLPSDTILGACDYDDGARVPAFDKAAAYGHEVWGGSAIRRGFDPAHTCLGELQRRIDNVQRWHTWAPKQNCGTLLHTFWGRSRSLMPIYGPWEGYLPAVLAAGGMARFEASPLSKAIAIVDAGMQSHEFQTALDAAAALDGITPADAFEREAIRWMQVALRHRHEMWWSVSCTQGMRGLRGVEKHIGFDPDIAALKRDERDQLHARLDALEADVRAFFDDNGWSDVEEFIASRSTNLRCEAG